MSIHLRRRDLFTGIAGIGAVLPGRAWAAALSRGFTHNVASGEPSQTSILLWTRYVPAGDAAALTAEIAEDSGFTRIVARREAVADAASDYCVRALAEGLEPGRWYYYRFRTASSETSPTGRTRTLPAGRTGRFNIAVFSCSNLPFGLFNAYAHAAERQDIDLVVHLGDYIYEYARGTYPSASEAMPGRIIDPAGEIVTPADYHARYAAYRRDRDLQMLHQRFPMISIWDDHEFTNDAWKDGAENHQSETEGPWETRKAAAKAAYRHWLPMSDAAYEAYEIGDLATLIRLDTRVEGRDRQLELADAFTLADDPAKALAAFRDTVWADPARQLLGAPQEAFLGDTLGRSVKAGTRWQVVAQQVLAGETKTPAGANASWLGGTPSDYVKQRFDAGVLAGKIGLPFNFDAWGGYPAARARYLGAAQAAGANLLNLAGDTHNAWAFDLANNGSPAGVEFGVQGVTSPGMESYMRGAAPSDVAAALVAANPELKWCETERRGYMTLSLTPDAAQCDWHFLDTIRTRSTAIAATHSATVRPGTNRMA
ncbi:alkaline phosphatase D family protein [Sphingosinicella soli]|uniref:Alkaline phosphatase D n=1 Tax=Sphingosinicella soli TaxID=333708 RepID=A0A7W7AZT9_9SPHN|nr:alkaline phosphatase D family protein [Sphingosinicella soli]MBB4631396.1 alkaline phosphatase D [Sphingosinicella soli]